MQQGWHSLIFLLVLLYHSDVKAVDFTTCEGDTARLACDLISKVITCESDTVAISCAQGHIKVLSANYGRTNRATCSDEKTSVQISNVYCIQSSSLSVLTNQCDGQRDCSVSVSNTIFGDPCVGTYKYLDVSYTCVPPGVSIQRQTACEGDTFSLNCDNRHIKVLSANYGRTNRAACSGGIPANQLSNIRCTRSSSLSVLTNQCDGEHTCSLSASNTVFGDPCPGTYKYLAVTYICHSHYPFIKVDLANYGRTNKATCSNGKPAHQLSNIYCAQSSSRRVLANRCNGQKVCSVPVTNAVFSDPCEGTYKYLKASYSCQPL
ncbi:L-rhamnose-binding lectin CSL3-like [Paramisgurnus dabryanus]|uniref:L-rhamnose-binding lectin CSL3-like n=1 Tax=Paramisgurnus dabryanus TaxID=90735 RepID=UPI0031F4007B